MEFWVLKYLDYYKVSVMGLSGVCVGGELKYNAGRNMDSGGLVIGFRKGTRTLLGAELGSICILGYKIWLLSAAS